MNHRLTRFWYAIGMAFLLWTLWSLLMANVGAPFSIPLVRALVRVGVVAIPALLFLRGDTDAPDRTLGFTLHWKRGVTVGLAVVLLHLTIVSLRYPLTQLVMPTTVAVWVNYILFSPVAEELLFRRVAVSVLAARFGTTGGILLSSLLFSLFHLPWWLISGEVTGLALVSTLVTLFGYGIGFALLYSFTNSLWASVLPHCVNNLIAFTLNPP